MDGPAPSSESDVEHRKRLSRLLWYLSSSQRQHQQEQRQQKLRRRRSTTDDDGGGGGGGLLRFDDDPSASSSSSSFARPRLRRRRRDGVGGDDGDDDADGSDRERLDGETTTTSFASAESASVVCDSSDFCDFATAAAADGPPRASAASGGDGGAASASASSSFGRLRNRKRSSGGRLKGGSATAAPFSTEGAAVATGGTEEDDGGGRRCRWLRLTRPDALSRSAEGRSRDEIGRDDAEEARRKRRKRRRRPPSSSLRRRTDDDDDDAPGGAAADPPPRRRRLGAIYDEFFEIAQSGRAGDGNSSRHEEEIVWGFGNARLATALSGVVVDGPILEVLLEAELSDDGSVTVRPREHAGVSLDRDAVEAVAEHAASGRVVGGESRISMHSRLSELHKAASEMETSDLVPSDPRTYRKLLRRVATELCPGGVYRPSSSSSSPRPDDDGGIDVDGREEGRLVVTDGWRIYRRKRPSSVWSRDASRLAERLSSSGGGGGATATATAGVEEEPPPRAAMALTHGPEALGSTTSLGGGGSAAASGGRDGNFGGVADAMFEAIFGLKRRRLQRSSGDVGAGDGDRPDDDDDAPNFSLRRPPTFPLPTSASQDRIADLLLSRNAPAVVCEGPPGCGKTHTIANVVSAYLSRGKRVLVTSKGSAALSVLRDRLPRAVRDLVVDVSSSEGAGMGQLRRTAERLADRVSGLDAERCEARCRSLERQIQELEDEIGRIDSRLESFRERRRSAFLRPEGREFAELSLSLLASSPWLMRSATSWTSDEASRFRDRTERLRAREDDPSLRSVTGLDSPVPDGVLDLASARAGTSTSSVARDAAIRAVASVPVLGAAVGLRSYLSGRGEALDRVRVGGSKPRNREEWSTVVRAAELDRDRRSFREEVLSRSTTDGWSLDDVYDDGNNDDGGRRTTTDEGGGRRRSVVGRPSDEFVGSVRRLARLKELAAALGLAGEEEVDRANDVRRLDERRGRIVAELRGLAERSVEARVVAELGRSFSPTAQSALVRFAQVAGRAEFRKGSQQPSRMTRRQQRHRQEYLDAFEKCVRYIPCWILTSSQICDYLPAEFGLFDLVVVDEASQSDISVLCGMLRGKQWLIVGDGKQVSPTESFVSEDRIEGLRVSLPESPFKDSFLPGRSFFDLCAQAFPTTRVVLSEHFRCAPEIINFSNLQYYHGKLNPLRLPTSSERLSPSLVDVFLEDGQKNGKVNERECEAIVDMVRTAVGRPGPARSVGVISLMGHEQGRLIRRRLLDVIGPRKFREHDVLVSDPPGFQGNERDVVFLSMVCSPGRVPSQSQLVHAQRANVALSRARDRMVLVRSVDSGHVANPSDVKLPIIEFFAKHATEGFGSGADADADADAAFREKRRERSAETIGRPGGSLRADALRLLLNALSDDGYSVRDMKAVWDGAICVENERSSARMAVCVEGAGETKEEWDDVVTQQRSIERVGWDCLRIDALSLMVNWEASWETMTTLLKAKGVEKTPKVTGNDGEDIASIGFDRHVANNDASQAYFDRASSENQGKSGQAEAICVISSSDEEAEPVAHANPRCDFSDEANSIVVHIGERTYKSTSLVQIPRNSS